MKQVIKTEKAPGAIGPYSQGIKACNLMFISGQLPIDVSVSEDLITEPKAAARAALNNVKAIVEAGGATMDQVVKVTLFLTDMKDFTAVNEVYAEFFKDPCPSRSTYAVAGLPKGAVLEIEAIAFTG
ncbi:MAG: Rid family detoxifying hydrolase [Defluviitaleaceae bacterium]|nr:Rid family detoxifying hydrolase [Defluviitaleaceae bacterium]